jgi:hypothetical protein
MVIDARDVSYRHDKEVTVAAHKYRITACEIPPSARPGRSSFYREIVDEFLKKDIKAGLVDAPGHKTANVAAGLANAVKAAGAPLKVRRRGEHIYLERTGG